jgi:uncharacterized membrane protein
MSFCKACGNEVTTGQGFCPSCGRATQAVDQTGATGAVAAPVAAPASPQMTTNVAGALAYLAGFITGVIFLVIDPYKDNSFIRFHAYQSIFFNAAWFGFWIVWMIVSAVLTPLTAGFFGLIAIPLILLFSLVGLACWMWLMYQAYQQKLFRLPIVGQFAAQRAGVKP